MRVGIGPLFLLPSRVWTVRGSVRSNRHSRRFRLSYIVPEPPLSALKVCVLVPKLRVQNHTEHL